MSGGSARILALRTWHRARKTLDLWLTALSMANMSGQVALETVWQLCQAAFQKVGRHHVSY